MTSTSLGESIPLLSAKNSRPSDRPPLLVTYQQLEAAIEAIGFGKLHARLILAISLGSVAECMQFAMIGLLIPRFEMHDFEWRTSYNNELMASITGIGVLLGATIFGYFVDVFGRRIVFVSAIVGTFMFSVLLAFSINFEMFIAFLFMVGFCMGAQIPIDFTLAVEFLPKHNRGYYLSIVSIASATGWAISILLASLLMDVFQQNWRVFVFSNSLPLFFSIFSRYAIPESPQYLMEKGLYEEATDVLLYVGQYNGKLPGKAMMSPGQPGRPLTIPQNMSPEVGRPDQQAEMEKWEALKKLNALIAPIMSEVESENSRLSTPPVEVSSRARSLRRSHSMLEYLANRSSDNLAQHNSTAVMANSSETAQSTLDEAAPGIVTLLRVSSQARPESFVENGVSQEVSRRGTFIRAMTTDDPELFEAQTTQGGILQISRDPLSDAALIIADKPADKRYSPLTRLVSGGWLVPLTLVCIIWFTCAFTGVAIQVMLATWVSLKSGDTTMATINIVLVVGGLSNILGSILTAALIRLPSVSYRGLTFSVYAFCGLSVALSSIASDLQGVAVCVFFLMFFQQSIWGLMYLVTIELFPTACRGTAGGISQAFARSGSVIGPLVASSILSNKDIYAANLLTSSLGGMLIVAALCQLLLPESKPSLKDLNTSNNNGLIHSQKKSWQEWFVY
eukprot:GHVL01023377.1.p1 GENE.GHVL01023377.1~~GHVL01023377.1.p1  ORF type:complete len:678 (+),score=69.17 GHVL01023377.1:84-2117(+)